MSESKTICEIISTIKTELLDPLTLLISAAAALVFLYGVVEFIAGASNEDARTKGKRHMVWGLLGLVIIGVAWAIITILQNFFGPNRLGNFC